MNNNEKIHDLLTTALVILSRIKRGEGGNIEDVERDIREVLKLVVKESNQ